MESHAGLISIQGSIQPNATIRHNKSMPLKRKCSRCFIAVVCQFPKQALFRCTQRTLPRVPCTELLQVVQGRGHFSYGDTKACWFVYAHPCKKSKVMKTISFADCWPRSVTHLKGGRTEAAFSSFIRVKTSLQRVSSRMLQALSIQFLTQWLWAIVLHVYGGGRLCLQRGMNFGFGTQQVKAELPIRSNDHSWYF